MVLTADDVRCGLALQSGPNRCETFFANIFTCSSNVRPLSVENYQNCENCENNKNLRHS